ncbi:MAG: AlpA family phage regulatory protein [Deltaproteobacteria bacterium]|nr:AlpA family phage regulatory protein [Deltaproteobacteria bacterium]
MSADARRIIGIDEVCRLTGDSKSTINRRVKDGSFPPPRGRGRVRKWWLHEVEAWMAEEMATEFKPLAVPVPTSAQPAPEPPTT